MKVIAYDPYAPADRVRACGAELVSFDEALAQGDFFSLHMPLTPTTQNLFNRAAFAKMKKGVRSCSTLAYACSMLRLRPRLLSVPCPIARTLPCPLLHHNATVGQPG